MAEASVRALILAGGSGTRLWPRSTDARPKPFLALAGGESLLRATYRRAAAVAGPERVFVSGRAAHAALLRSELPEVPEPRFVLEPSRRNTAPAIALSALAACADDANAVMLVLPSDQAVADEPVPRRAACGRRRRGGRGRVRHARHPSDAPRDRVRVHGSCRGERRREREDFFE